MDFVLVGVIIIFLAGIGFIVPAALVIWLVNRWLSRKKNISPPLAEPVGKVESAALPPDPNDGIMPEISPEPVAASSPQLEKPVAAEESAPEEKYDNRDFIPLAEKIASAHREIGKKIFGMEDIVEQCMIALFSGGHVLCEGLPGLAKTTMAKAFAEVFSCEFRRCQFSPDLLPSDLLGDRIYNQVRNSFEFQKGPVFTQILLADEINRSPAKTQAALLEVMQEFQVTLFGTRHLIGAVDGIDDQPQANRIFCTIATQNPVEQEGTYRLPEAQLDRFMFRLFFDWPSRESELAVLNNEGTAPPSIVPCLTAREIVFWKKKIAEEIFVPEPVKDLIVDTVRATRNADEVAVGAGPRASQVLLRGAKVAAAFDGRSYVTEKDVRKLIFPVLNHRLIIKPEVLFEHPDQTGKALLENIIRKITAK